MKIFLAEDTHFDLFTIAHMILYDECPPDRRYYLCLHEEDDSCACTRCWDRYLWDVFADKRN